MIGEAGFHELHVRQEVALLVEAGELDSELVALNLFEETVCNPLGRLAHVVAREHAVDVGVVHRPEPLSDVHRVVVDTGDYENLVIWGDFSLFFEALELLD